MTFRRSDGSVRATEQKREKKAREDPEEKPFQLKFVSGNVCGCRGDERNKSPGRINTWPLFEPVAARILSWAQ